MSRRNAKVKVDDRPAPPESGARATAPSPITSTRRFLLCVRLGAASAFEKWFDAEKPRSWDLLLSFYADAGSDLSKRAEYVSVGGLSKFTAVKDMYLADRSIFDNYEYVWFLDDDIEIPFENVDAFFMAIAKLQLHLAQPSLTADSFCSFKATVHDPACVVRYTNFVEIMMPAFSRAALQTCIDSFDKSVSGWGLDYAWAKRLGYPERKIAIVDAIVARHTKPIDEAGGAFYAYLRRLGVDARSEFREIVNQFGILSDAYPKTTGMITREQLDAAVNGRARIDPVQKIRRRYLDLIERALSGAMRHDPATGNTGRHTAAERLRNLRRLSEQVVGENIPGDFLVTGVGGADAGIMFKAILTAYECANRKVFVAEFVAGPASPEPEDRADAGSATAQESLKGSFAEYDLLEDNVVFLKGSFEDGLPNRQIEKLALLRLGVESCEFDTGGPIEPLSEAEPRRILHCRCRRRDRAPRSDRRISPA